MPIHNPVTDPGICFSSWTSLLPVKKVFSFKRLSGGTRLVKYRFSYVFYSLLRNSACLLFNMPIHNPVTDPGICFITFTCHQWLSLLELTNGYDIVYNWFNIFSAKGHAVVGYVIMPNHLHLLMHYSGTQPLNTIIGNGKRFMAYSIVKRLEEQNESTLLTRLQHAVHQKDRSRGKKHEVWIDSFDAKQCRTEKFILQKLHYIHNNPCSGKWKLACSPIHYQHSSALFYINGKQAAYPVKDYREFLYNSLWEE